MHNHREATGYYSSPRYTHSYEPSYTYHRPNYALTGAALGGIAGGVIGHNSGRKTAEGIAIGAGAGLLLGAVAEQHARIREHSYAPAYPVYTAHRSSYFAPRYACATPVTVVERETVVQPRPVQTTTTQVTIINNYYGNSTLGSANGLFGR